jgi:hypothetical protein
MQDKCLKAEVCVCKLEPTSHQTSCDVKGGVTRKSWQIQITASTGGNKEVVPTSSVREMILFKPTLPHYIEGNPIQVIFYMRKRRNHECDLARS